MECPSCYEVYNEEERVPRNLPCGHTYCENCLTQIQIIKKRLECPVCRLQLDSSVMPKALSKNFVAAEIACKYREIQKKLLFCSNHKEPLRFFCETCQQNICPSCIIDHSGHKFVKQDHSASLLKERTLELKVKVNKKLEDLNNAKSFGERSRENIVVTKEEQLKYIDDEFDKVINKLNAQRNLLKKKYQDICQKELGQIDTEVSKLTTHIENISKHIKELEQYHEKVEKTKIVQGDALQKELNEIEEMINKDIKQSNANISNNTMSLPKVIFDPMIYKSIFNMGNISNTLENMRICFFGEKNKVLMYNVEKDEWKLSHLPFGQSYEFNYYSSAVTLPNGSILVTGGGISNAVYQIFIVQPSNSSRPAVEIVPKAQMNQTRKEHASVILQNSVYVLGGYDGTLNSFLSSCEKYDLETDEWKPVAPMLIAKCAFGATTVANRYIFAVGGYDGHERLNTIEKYDSKLDKWVLLEVQLKQPLSNSACFAYSDSSIVILGGGYNIGFCLEMNLLDINSSEWKQLAPMTDGRDLRNKLVPLNGTVYAIGGNNCFGEKYSIKKNEWTVVKSYQQLVNDNLDSWACALYYDLPGTKPPIVQNEELRSTSTLKMYQQIPALNPYQYYQYEEQYEEEIFSEQSSAFDDWS